MTLYNWFRKTLCEDCGVVVANHSANTRRCPKCAKVAIRKRNRLYMQKQRRLARVRKVA